MKIKYFCPPRYHFVVEHKKIFKYCVEDSIQCGQLSMRVIFKNHYSSYLVVCFNTDTSTEKTFL